MGVDTAIATSDGKDVHRDGERDARCARGPQRWTDVATRYRTDAPVNAMSVDVEDYFQVSAFEAHVSREDWNHRTLRVEGNVDRILALFDAHGVKATFFTLGWIAERCPQMVTRIVAEGHELASHGYDHTRVTQQDADTFRDDVVRTRGVLEDLGGTAVLGYRAASYSIGESNLWALDVLAETGHRYSSSIYPIRHDLYGIPDAPRFAFETRPGDLLELPVSTVQVSGRRIPCGGGGFFRLFPYALSRAMIHRVNRVDQQPTIFYFHPWEVDPEQPKLSGLGLKTRVRHYLNLDRTSARLSRLLEDFRWAPLRDVYDVAE
jgi:polysaccharide deacetylase family protein (PEP-CTERM system associated)